MNNITKYLITVIISIIFVIILVAKIKTGLALSFAILFGSIYWIVAKQIDEKNFLLGFVIIYPLLPSLAGINLGVMVLSYQRLAVILLLIFFIRKGLLIKYHLDFYRANIFSFNFIVLILSMFVSSYLSANTSGTFSFSISLILEFFIFSVVIFSVFKTDEDIEKLINALLISCTILCFFGLIEKALNYNFYSKFGNYLSREGLEAQMRGGSIRVQASFSHSIAYGAYLVTILPLFMYRFKSNFVHFNMTFLLVMSAILASQSRAGMMGAAIIIILYYLVVEKKNLALIIILSIPIVIYYSGGILQYLIDLNPLTATRSDLVNSTAARGNQFQIMTRLIKQNIVFGFGLVDNGLRTVDNFYLVFTYVFGLSGLVSYFALLISVISKPFRIIGIKIFKDVRTLVLLFSIIAFSIINTVVALWSFQFIYYLYIGIIARVIKNRRDLVNDQTDSI